MLISLFLQTVTQANENHYQEPQTCSKPATKKVKKVQKQPFEGVP